MEQRPVLHGELFPRLSGAVDDFLLMRECPGVLDPREQVATYGPAWLWCQYVLAEASAVRRAAQDEAGLKMQELSLRRQR